jgi:tetratricopeptide (TPR) repeat protein
MRSFWTVRRLVLCSVIVLTSTEFHPAWAQKTVGGAGSASPSGSSSGSIGLPSGGRSISNPFPGSNSTGPDATRPIFLSGKVMFDDGSQPNTNIRIERVCGGSPRLETHTDGKGKFSFQVGQNLLVDDDAADGTPGPLFGRSGQPTGSGRSMNNSMNPLWNCELRAAYPGYRSDTVQLATRRTLDDPDVGTIILHHLTNVQGSTISLTSALAPKRAQKDYEKGLQSAQKGKFEDAEKYLEEATASYPKYAVALFTLGEVQKRQGQTENARKSFQSAIQADGKYVSPYDRLAVLSGQEGKWDDAASLSKKVIELNPVEFPSAFWCNAVANYNLNKPTEAEKSAKELIKLDTGHKYPDAESLLGEILLSKGEYSEAATHLRTYLTLVPKAKNAEQIKQMLLKIDETNGAPRQ